jgi:galactokinase
MYMQPVYQRGPVPSTARERALEGFDRRFGGCPEVLVRAPGRVNLIGEHVDYNQGLVLPAAIDRAAWVAASAAPGEVAAVEAIDLGARVLLTSRTACQERGADGVPLAAWARYPAGVARALAAQGLAVPAARVAVASDVPIGAGLASSAPLEVAFAAMWQRLAGWRIDGLDLARLCQRAEAEAAGVHCGLMDQFAAVHGRKGHALLLDCRTFAWKPLPLPAHSVLMIADTGVRRALASSEFNLRRRQCEEAVARLRAAMEGLASLRDVSTADLERHRDLLPEPLLRRARHVVEEIARVRIAVTAMEEGDPVALGRAMTAGHRSARDLYEVSCHELDALVAAALAIDGCYGSRLTGAGFGGCTVSLVAASGAARFATELASAYRAATGGETTIWRCTPDDGVEVTSGAAVPGSRD